MSENKEKRLNVYRQRVTMAALQVDGLSQVEIARALAYEVEPFSGILGDEADVSFEVVASHDSQVRIFDVTVKRKTQSAKGIDCKKALRAAAFVWVVLFVAIAADFLVLSGQIKSLSASVEARRPIDARLRTINSKISENNLQASRLEANCKAAENARSSVAAKRAAYCALMEEVASGCAGQMVVKAFNSDGPFSVEMQGSSTSVESCTQALLDLTRAAARASWLVSPGRMSADETGSVISFSCSLIYVGASAKEGGR